MFWKSTAYKYENLRIYKEKLVLSIYICHLIDRPRLSEQLGTHENVFGLGNMQITESL